MIDENEKLANLSKELEKLSNDRKFNFFSTVYSERDSEHYEIIGHLLNPHEKHNLQDYFIKQIIDIIKDKYQIDNENYMDLCVRNYYKIPNDKGYNDMQLQLTAVSMTNKVFFIFLVETEYVDMHYTIVWLENYKKILKQIDCIKQLYKTYQVIPILIIDAEQIGKRYDALYTIPFDKIITIMKKMLKEEIKDKHYKFIIQEYIKSRERSFMIFNNKKYPVPWEKYLKLYSKYAQEINDIQYLGSTYYIKKILLHIFKNKSFIENVTIEDCNIDSSPSFTFLPSGLDDNLIEMFYKNSYILGFDIHVYTHSIEAYFTLRAKDDKMQLLKEKLISLFNNKYKLNYKNNRKEDMYITLHKLDIDTHILIYVDEKTLMKELDRFLDELYDKIISVKKLILDTYSK